MARTLIASDNFNRAGPALGANWASLNSGGGGDVLIDSSIKIKGQYSTQAGDNRAVARWVGTGTYTDDQYSKLTLPAPAGFGATSSVGVICRASADTNAGRDYYECWIESDSAVTTKIGKWVNGTQTVFNSGAVAWANGDTISLEVTGTAGATIVKAFRNDVAIGGSFTYTDTSGFVGGAPGVTASNSAPFGDDWEGGTVTGSSAPTLTSPSGTGGTLVCSGSVSTTGTNGTLYAVVTGSATAPTAAQVKLGQDNAGAAALRVISQAVSASGTQTIASGAVTAGTRYLHFMHEDGSANQSAVVSSASFTVAASGVASFSILSWVNNAGTSLANTGNINISFHNTSTRTMVLYLTGQTTNSSGHLTGSNAALTTGSTYTWLAESSTDATAFGAGRVTAT